jgi:hypothetical protein
VAQLAGLARGEQPKSNRPFVERFIRPRGASIAATPVFVQTVEGLAAGVKPQPTPVPLWVFLLRPLVYALVLAGRLPLVERMYWNPAKFKVHASSPQEA